MIQRIYMIESLPMMAADTSIRIACSSPAKVPVTKEMQLFQYWYSLHNPKNLYDRIPSHDGGWPIHIACFNPTKVPVTKEVQFNIGILCIIQKIYVIETCPMMAADPSIRIACCNPTKVPVTKEMQLFQHWYSLHNPKNLYDRISSREIRWPIHTHGLF